MLSTDDARLVKKTKFQILNDET